MLILSDSKIKTTFILLLFTALGVYSPATVKAVCNSSGKSTDFAFALSETGYWFNSEDTIKQTVLEIKKDIAQLPLFVVPAQFANEVFEFHINSEITCRSFSHFIKSESRKLFFEAFMKEKKMTSLTAESDSLRKIYSHSSSEKQEEIAARILSNESQSIALSQEIPTIYQQVREEEDRYWKLATQDEINQFKEKIRLFSDSISKVKLAQEVKNQVIVPDTLIVYDVDTKVQEVKADPNAGIIYKIQIGAYKGKIPDTADRLIKKLSIIRKIENYKDEKGVHVYTTGNLRSYQEAVTMQGQLKQEGVKNAIVAAYHNGKRIPLAEARKINNEL